MVTFTPIQIDFSLITSAMNARINQQVIASGGAAPTAEAQRSSAAEREVAVGRPPWQLDDPDFEKLALSALRSGSLISSSAAQRALATQEETPKIFEAYDALVKLRSLAQGFVDETISSAYSSRAESRISEGITEIRDFLSQADFNSVTMIAGERLSRAVTDAAIERVSYETTTPVLHTGAFDDPVAAWADKSGFTITVDKINNPPVDVNIDLSGLANTDRTLDNVVSLINTELEAAGMITRFERTKIGPLDDNGFPTGDDYGFKIQGVQTEPLSFSTPTAKPALYMLGTSGTTERATAQLSKWTGLDQGTATLQFTDLIAAESVAGTDDEDDVSTDDDALSVDITPHANTRFLATAAGSDGSVYALLETEGELEDHILRGENDLALVKYDSTGRQVWTRHVGASEAIEGTSLAVSDDGRIAIGGTSRGDLTETAVGSEKTGFVLVYDSNGQETLARQIGSAEDDSVTSLAFDTMGALYVGGRTSSNLSGEVHNGGVDAFVTKLDTDGSQLWTNQWGTAGDESVSSLAIDDTGGVIASVQSGGTAQLQRVSGDAFTADDWSHSIGEANINDIHFDNGSVYIAGNTRLDGFTGDSFTGTTQSHSDGFALRVDVAGTTVTQNWVQRFGGASDQSMAEIQVDNGKVYLAGTATGGLGLADDPEDINAIIGSFDAATGAQDWMENLAGYGGDSAAAGLAISQSADSDLDVFGLPSGQLQLGDVENVSDRTSARVGDHFFISVNGGRQKQITLEEGDTYRALTFKLNAALLLDGQASTRGGSDGRTLRIEPENGSRIELTRGANGQDLIKALGLPEGVIFETNLLDDGSDETSSDAPPPVALGLGAAISLKDTTTAQEVVDLLDGALRGLRKAWRYATEDPTLQSLSQNNERPNQNTTAVSAYQQAQLANLQAGLARLQAGGTSNGFGGLLG